MRAVSPPRFIACALLALAANSACAQYVWVDEKGIKQFSDRPPPASVPDKSILKQPGPPRTAPAAAEAPPAPKPAALTLAERELEFRKRAQEQAEREHKAADERRQQAARQQACATARASLAQLASGERIRTVGADGARAVMGDAERAQQTAAARRILAACR